MATAAAGLAARGIEPPLLCSGNADGGHGWNTRVMDEYRDRVFLPALSRRTRPMPAPGNHSVPVPRTRTHGYDVSRCSRS
jgi:hypothetical protein